MKKIRVVIISAFVAVLAAGCGVAERSVKKSPVPSSSHPKKQDQPSSGKDSPVSPKTKVQRPGSSLPAAVSVSKVNEIRASLQQAYRDWKGTPYDLGGQSHRGIDCSAFVQQLFKQYFGIKLPRNTHRQLYAGRAVRRHNLATGDLIFFKTGRRTLHVGVMMNGQRFLHASTSQGVTTSSLDNLYWKSRYLSARRVLALR